MLEEERRQPLDACLLDVRPAPDEAVGVSAEVGVRLGAAPDATRAAKAPRARRAKGEIERTRADDTAALA